MPVTWNDYLALPPHQRAIWPRALHNEFHAIKTINTLFPVPIHIAPFQSSTSVLTWPMPPGTRI
jgi:hypothetical protein